MPGRLLEEGHQFAVAPLGLQVARRDDRDQHRRASQLILDFSGEHLRSRQPLVTPDVDASSDVDVDEVLQVLVKRIDPAALAIAEGLVVDVAVADEDVVAEAGNVRRRC